LRLTILDHGHRTRAKVFMRATALVSRVDTPDIVRMLLYRPEFMSGPLLRLTAPAMRGPSYWTAAEREYMAMEIARSHRCPFCLVTHTELVRIAGAGTIDPTDPASTRPELRAVLAGETGGLPPEAVAEARRVRLVWDVVNRLANSFGFELRPGQLETGTRSLHRFGYRFPTFLVGGGAADLGHSVLEAPAVTSPELRQAAATGDPWPPYATNVREASYRITDDDVRQLVDNGHTEDEIFEVTAAAAVGAALRTYEARSSTG
jgi:AhpD family alkylhydroperoxidase